MEEVTEQELRVLFQGYIKQDGNGGSFEEFVNVAKEMNVADVKWSAAIVAGKTSVSLGVREQDKFDHEQSNREELVATGISEPIFVGSSANSDQKEQKQEDQKYRVKPRVGPEHHAIGTEGENPTPMDERWMEVAFTHIAREEGIQLSFNQAMRRVKGTDIARLFVDLTQRYMRSLEDIKAGRPIQAARSGQANERAKSSRRKQQSMSDTTGM